MGFGYDNSSDNNRAAALPEVIANNPAVQPAEPVVVETPDEKLAKRKYVADTFHNQVGINEQRFGDILKDLKGFAEGSTIKVTYYKEHYSETDIKGRTSTNESEHNAHKSVLKIKDFEMRLTGPLQYDHDAGQAISVLRGEALTYPGFQPEIGDRFVYEIDTGVYAIFNIPTQPIRTSIRASTYFKISFTLYRYINEELAEQMDEGVVDTAYFDKLRFLNEPGALLTHDEVVEMRYLTEQRAKMIQYYRQKFLDDKIMYSYMRPDGIHDPYVTDFMIHVLDFSEMGSMAVQLFRDAPHMEDNIWQAILDKNLPLQVVPIETSLQIHKLGSKSVIANSLINKVYTKWVDGSMNLQEYFDSIDPEEEEEEPSGDIPADPSIPELPDDDEAEKTLGDLLLHFHPHYRECPLIPEDGEGESGTREGIGYILGEGEHFALMYHFLKTRKIVTVKRLHDLIEAAWKDTNKTNQFYRFPIYIYLCSIALRGIHREEGIFEP